jgi:hypothetical protein
MKALTLVLAAILLSTFFHSLSAQSHNPLLEFNQKRLNHQKSAMIVLGSWAVGNLASGAIFQSRRSGVEKHFHQMNMGWGAVNLGIATLGYWRAVRKNSKNGTLASSLKDFNSYQKTLLFNAGLDVGYVAGGLYLMERSRRYSGKKADQQKGWGQSIILQGAFLFTFDLIAYWTSTKYTENIRPLMTLDPQLGQAQLGLRLSF